MLGESLGSTSICSRNMLDDVTVKWSVRETAEVLGSLLNTHKCLMQSGAEIQKRLKFHPTSRKMEIFRRPSSVSLGNTPETQFRGKNREAPFSPGERIAKKGKGSTSASYSEATRSQTPKEVGS